MGRSQGGGRAQPGRGHRKGRAGQMWVEVAGPAEAERGDTKCGLRGAPGMQAEVVRDVAPPRWVPVRVDGQVGGKQHET